jgi:hypothetical protein
MIKIIIQILFIVIVIAYLAEIKISFKPFVLAFPNWRSSFGIIVICIGVGIYYNAAFRKGHSKAIDQVMEIIDKQIKDKK